MLRKLVALLPMLALALPASAAVPVTGRYMTPEKDSIIAVGPCGAKICGRIERILKTTPGYTGLDANNPDPAMRTRPIQGMPILLGFVDGGKKWDGTIYDPRRGKSFRSELVKLANGNLQVKGCLGPFCQTLIWTPVL
jgi:uncharacterized protein (DUF2147 family)